MKIATAIILASAPFLATSCSEADMQAFQEECGKIHEEFRRWFCRNADDIIRIVDFVDDAARRVQMIAQLSTGDYSPESVAFYIAAEIFDVAWEPKIIRAAVKEYCSSCGGLSPHMQSGE
jgi:hypothetical protein